MPKEETFQGEWRELEGAIASLDFEMEDVASCGPKGRRGEAVYAALREMGQAIGSRNIERLEILAHENHCEGYTQKLRDWLAARAARRKLLDVIRRFGQPDEQP